MRHGKHRCFLTRLDIILAPKMEPKILQYWRKKTPWAPRAPKGAPKGAQGAPKAAQGVQKGPPWDPQGLHFGPFWLNFGPFGHIFGTSERNFGGIVIPSGIPPAQTMRTPARCYVFRVWGVGFGHLAGVLMVWAGGIPEGITILEDVFLAQIVRRPLIS